MSFENRIIKTKRWVKTFSRPPMKYHEDCKTAISQSGKATVIISKTTKMNGDGNAPRLFCTTEDLFTIVCPSVRNPDVGKRRRNRLHSRERDTQKMRSLWTTIHLMLLYLEVGSKKLNGTEPR